MIVIFNAPLIKVICVKDFFPKQLGLLDLVF
jgi:hypothetical protein